ncbi:hypothetical protein [Acidithiobacillus sp.]|uniref:hypothetical protein n=1 Tax=Acidithiobacillus sp. TaxID=1872118 RepID=UPI003D03EA14
MPTTVSREDGEDSPILSIPYSDRPIVARVAPHEERVKAPSFFSTSGWGILRIYGNCRCLHNGRNQRRIGYPPGGGGGGGPGGGGGGAPGPPGGGGGGGGAAL